MQSFLRRAWDALTKKLGAVSAFILPIARTVEIGIAENDSAKILSACDEWDKRAHETRETLDAGDELVAHMRQSLADGNISAIEAGTGALLVEKLIDEAEDIATGVDEDDPQEAAATP